MDLPIAPPFPPMLGRLARELPRGDYLYEPKWDGFRCLAFRSGDEVDLRSRHGRPLARYFPELVDALLARPAAAELAPARPVRRRGRPPAVGVAGSFGVRQAESLLEQLRPCVVPLDGHPWERGDEALERIDRLGDLFAPVLELEQRLP